MLNYLDGYPLSLPCRYNDRVACYTKVFIISNIDLRWQYDGLQRQERESWQAFLRRIHYVRVFQNQEETLYTTKEYMQGFTPLPPNVKTPFAKDDT